MIHLLTILESNNICQVSGLETQVRSSDVLFRLAPHHGHPWPQCGLTAATYLRLPSWTPPKFNPPPPAASPHQRTSLNHTHTIPRHLANSRRNRETTREHKEVPRSRWRDEYSDRIRAHLGTVQGSGRPLATMPTYKNSQEWLQQSSLLLQARPATVRPFPCSTFQVLQTAPTNPCRVARPSTA